MKLLTLKSDENSKIQCLMKTKDLFNLFLKLRRKLYFHEGVIGILEATKKKIFFLKLKIYRQQANLFKRKILCSSNKNT